MIYSILLVQFTCLTVLFRNLCHGLLWSLTSTSYSMHFFTQSPSFQNTCPYHRSLFCCNTNVMMSSIPNLSLSSLLGNLSFSLTPYRHLSRERTTRENQATKLHCTQCTRIQSAAAAEVAALAEFVLDNLAAFAGVTDLLLASATSPSLSDIYTIKDRNTQQIRTIAEYTVHCRHVTNNNRSNWNSSLWSGQTTVNYSCDYL